MSVLIKKNCLFVGTQSGITSYERRIMGNDSVLAQRIIDNAVDPENWTT